MKNKKNIAEIAWLAGIIDGEGSIGIKRTRDKRKGRASVIYGPAVQITNCDFVLLNEVERILNENSVNHYFWKGHEKKRNLKWNTSGNIGVGSISEVIKFIKLVEPYLVSKKERAQILVEFCLLKEGKRGRNEKGVFYKISTFDEEPYWLKLHALNKKGKKD